MSTTSVCYLVIAVDGTAAIHHRDVASTDELADTLAADVGGAFTLVRTDYPQFGIWCNEDGGPLRLPTNRVATAVVFLLGGPTHALVGPVVITGQTAAGARGLTDDELDSILGIVHLCQ
jgi:hypothetical protein